MDSTYETNLGFFLPDGTYEPMFNPEEDMACLIREKIGPDAEKSFRLLMSNCGSEAREDMASDIAEVCWEMLRHIEDIEGNLSCDVPDLSAVGKALEKLKEVIDKIENNAWNKL